MACRVGITTNKNERRQHWEKKYPRTFRNWEIKKTCLSKSAAQSEETRLAQAHGCQAHPGGAGSEDATWYVYYFEHDGS